MHPLSDFEYSIIKIIALQSFIQYDIEPHWVYCHSSCILSSDSNTLTHEVSVVDYCLLAYQKLSNHQISHSLRHFTYML